jgi:hypothetical protein
MIEYDLDTAHSTLLVNVLRLLRVGRAISGLRRLETRSKRTHLASGNLYPRSAARSVTSNTR